MVHTAAPCSRTTIPEATLARFIASGAGYSAASSYVELLSNERRSMLFRLDNLHTAFEVTLERSRQQWGLLRRHRRYICPERYLRAGIDGQSRSQRLESSLFDRKTQHADARLGELYGSVLDLIRKTVEDVVRAYGYEVG
jgi:hypothetical protein